MLTVPAAFTRQTGEAHWHVLLRARAIENGAFVVAAAQGGLHEDGRETFGHSMIVAPWGEVLAEADHDEPAVIVADIDPEASAAARARIPNLRNAREFTLRRVGGHGGGGGIMIRFSLQCDHDHEFEGWFRNNDDFEAQAGKHLVACPVCGSHAVGKTLMAPAVSTGRQKEKIAVAMGEMQRQIARELRQAVKKVRDNADYVGDKFAEEARKIHFGETDPRAIYGEATFEEVTSLEEDGVDVMPLPEFPDDQN